MGFVSDMHYQFKCFFIISVRFKARIVFGF